MRDYYKVLGVEQDATAETIKRIYRKLAKEHHPDLHPGDKKAEARFKEVSEAYGVLGDTEAKEEYDRLRFGAHPTYGVKARPVNTEIFVSQAMESFTKAGMKKSRGTSYGVFPSFGTRSKSSARSRSRRSGTTRSSRRSSKSTPAKPSPAGSPRT